MGRDTLLRHEGRALESPHGYERRAHPRRRRVPDRPAAGVRRAPRGARRPPRPARAVAWPPRRAERVRSLQAGALPDFLAETAGVREGDWRIAPFPDEIADRR